MFFSEGIQHLHIRNGIKYCKQKSATYCFSVFLLLNCLYVSVHISTETEKYLFLETILSQNTFAWLLFLNWEENSFAL